MFGSLLIALVGDEGSNEGSNKGDAIRINNPDLIFIGSATSA